MIENMSGFTTPDGERFPIFGEGGGQALADELDVPLLGKVPLTMAAARAGRRGRAADRGRPRRPGGPGVRQAARGLIALMPMQPVELPVLQAPRAGRSRPRRSGMSLPMA